VSENATPTYKAKWTKRSIVEFIPLCRDLLKLAYMLPSNTTNF